MNFGGKATLTRLLAVILALLGAWFLNHEGNPKALLKPNRNPLVKEVFPWRTVCAGIQCLGCGFRCFLPEGFTGECGQRMNQGERAVTRTNPVPR